MKMSCFTKQLGIDACRLPTQTAAASSAGVSKQPDRGTCQKRADVSVRVRWCFHRVRNGNPEGYVPLILQV